MDHEYSSTINDSQISYVEKEGDELLIDLVKSYPHLYDKKCNNYKDIIMKDNSWAEIASIMNWKVYECQNRWLRLREKFGREVKKCQNTTSGMESQSIQKWPLYEQMKFLDKYINPRKRLSNTQYQSCAKRTIVDDAPNVFDERSDQEGKDSPIVNQLPGCSSAMETPKSCYTPQGKKKKQDAVDASFIELSSAIKNHLSSASRNAKESDDADDLFCKFITAELKKKSEECKRKLKREITILICSSE